MIEMLRGLFTLSFRWFIIWNLFRIALFHSLGTNKSRMDWWKCVRLFSSWRTGLLAFASALPRLANGKTFPIHHIGEGGI